MFLRCLIHQLRVEQKFIDHASRPLQQLEYLHLVIAVGGRPLCGASWKTRVGFLNSAIHFTTVWYDGAGSP